MTITKELQPNQEPQKSKINTPLTRALMTIGGMIVTAGDVFYTLVDGLNHKGVPSHLLAEVLVVGIGTASMLISYGLKNRSIPSSTEQ